MNGRGSAAASKQDQPVSGGRHPSRGAGGPARGDDRKTTGSAARHTPPASVQPPARPGPEWPPHDVAGPLLRRYRQGLVTSHSPFTSLLMSHRGLGDTAKQDGQGHAREATTPPTQAVPRPALRHPSRSCSARAYRGGGPGGRGREDGFGGGGPTGSRPVAGRRPTPRRTVASPPPRPSSIVRAPDRSRP